MPVRTIIKGEGILAIRCITDQMVPAGFWYDAASGFYYDANTQLCYDSKNTKQWVSYDATTGQYVPAGSSAAAPTGQPQTSAVAAGGHFSCMKQPVL